MINATLCANPAFVERTVVKYALLGPPEAVGEVCGIMLQANAGGNGIVLCGDRMEKARADGVHAMEYMPLKTLQTVLDEVGVLDYQAFKMDVEGFGAGHTRAVTDLACPAARQLFCSPEFSHRGPRRSVRCRVQGAGRHPGPARAVHSELRAGRADGSCGEVMHG